MCTFVLEDKNNSRHYYHGTGIGTIMIINFGRQPYFLEKGREIDMIESNLRITPLLVIFYPRVLKRKVDPAGFEFRTYRHVTASHFVQCDTNAASCSHFGSRGARGDMNNTNRSV